MKVRPYISFDIESTGLNLEKSQILQLGWVIDDGVSSIDRLKTGSIFIQNDAITYGENYALGMNAWIFQELMKNPRERKYPTHTLISGVEEFTNAVREAAELAFEFDANNGVKKPKRNVQVAGKNVGSFDIPIVKNNLKAQNNEAGNSALYELEKYLDHRTIDCGAIFFHKFGKNAGFADINKMIGYKEITHDAVEDALNVVVAIRYLMGLHF